MQKKIALLSILFSLTISAASFGMDSAIDRPHSLIESVQDHTVTAPAKTNLLLNFYRFLRIFLLLLSNPTVQQNLKMINKLLISLVQTAGQIIQNSAVKGIDLSNELIIEAIDPSVTQEMIRTLRVQTRTLIILKNRPTPADYDRQDKEEVQQIMNSFAGVMQGFFTIVQDPENKENILQGVAGMLGNIIAAGKVIMKGSDIPLTADEETIEKWIDEIDDSIKYKLLHQIHNQRKSIKAKFHNN